MCAYFHELLRLTPIQFINYNIKSRAIDNVRANRNNPFYIHTCKRGAPNEKFKLWPLSQYFKNDLTMDLTMNWRTFAECNYKNAFHYGLADENEFKANATHTNVWGFVLAPRRIANTRQMVLTILLAKETSLLKYWLRNRKQCICNVWYLPFKRRKITKRCSNTFRFVHPYKCSYLTFSQMDYSVTSSNFCIIFISKQSILLFLV
jgi:hypothetical protein